MFTGIIESLGEVVNIENEGTNVHFTVKSKFTQELKIDQSVAHNGVCLTVVSLYGDKYVVTAIQETLQKTNLSSLKLHDIVNLERGMKLDDRLDGHLVQGHVDQTGRCIAIKEENGSWIFTFQYDESLGNITIEKGSITISGTSLTVVNSKTNRFSVAIIPYTYENTIFKNIKINDLINLEFDVIGKYVARLHDRK